eukprot:6212143-Pleurochrysis_carterae.AAC.1
MSCEPSPHVPSLRSNLRLVPHSLQPPLVLSDPPFPFSRAHLPWLVHNPACALFVQRAIAVVQPLPSVLTPVHMSTSHSVRSSHLAGHIYKTSSRSDDGVVVQRHAILH